MNFLQKLDFLIEREGLNKHTLSAASGIPYTTIVGLYERGAENARLSTVNKLCHFFNVPLDYMALDEYDKPEDFRPNNNTAMEGRESAEEKEMISLFRSLGTEARNTLLVTARAFAGNPDMQKERTKSETA